MRSGVRESRLNIVKATGIRTARDLVTLRARYRYQQDDKIRVREQLMSDDNATHCQSHRDHEVKKLALHKPYHAGSAPKVWPPGDILFCRWSRGHTESAGLASVLKYLYIWASVSNFECRCWHEQHWTPMCSFKASTSALLSYCSMVGLGSNG